jgi:hypothetical protein
MNYREGVNHARLRRLDTESPMDKRPSVHSPKWTLVHRRNFFMRFVS